MQGRDLLLIMFAEEKMVRCECSLHNCMFFVSELPVLVSWMVGFSESILRRSPSHVCKNSDISVIMITFCSKLLLDTWRKVGNIFYELRAVKLIPVSSKLWYFNFPPRTLVQILLYPLTSVLTTSYFFFLCKECVSWVSLDLCMTIIFNLI